MRVHVHVLVSQLCFIPAAAASWPQLMLPGGFVLGAVC